MNDNQEKGKAQHDIGISYIHRFNGFVINSDAARRLLTESAELGYADGQYELGVLLLGCGKAEQAFKWLLSAAKLGHRQAMYTLSCSLGAGIGCKVDDESCVEWFIKAEAANND